jgi:putative effector of murein hydrolase
MGGYQLLEPGVTRYHTVGLIVPLLSAIFPFMISPLFKRFERQHHVITALLLGLCTTIFAYILYRYVPFLRETTYTLNKAVLLGLLVSEIMVFSYPKGDWDDRMISAPMLSFYIFMFYFGLSEVQRV